MLKCTLKPASVKQTFTCSQSSRKKTSVSSRIISAVYDERLEFRRLAGATIGTVTALSFLLSAPSADAVSGGGGSGNSLAFVDFTNQDLRKSKYVKADLRGANFSGANLEGVTLFGSICVDAKFVGANLRLADLESVDLEGADLSNAVLEGAMLTNTQFKLIKSIEGADFTDTLIRRDVAQGLCKIAKGINPTTGVSTAESLNCS